MTTSGLTSSADPAGGFSGDSVELGALDRAGIEQRVFTKAARRIVPLIVVLYLVSFLDRVNLGFAALTMNKDLALSPAIFGLGSGIFFIGYFLFEVPSNLILHRVGARRWIARVMISWGLVSGATAFITGPKSFCVLRFVLGIAEAGFFPGIILYLSYWFLAPRRSVVTAFFMLGAPLAGVVGSPISAALLRMNGVGGLRGWQWLFLMEAAPAILLGFVVWAYMTDRPANAAWLTPAERNWLTSEIRLENEQAQTSGKSAGTWQALRNPRVIVLSFVYFGLSMALYALGLWLPQMIQAFGVSNSAVGWIAALPYVVASIGMVLWARHSDRTRERLWHVIAGCLLSAAGMAAAGMLGSIVGVVAALSLAALGMSAARPPLWSLPTQFLGGAAAAVGIASINSFGNLGGFAGPFAMGWLKTETGKFSRGLDVVAAALVLSAAALALIGEAAPARPEPALAPGENFR